MELIGNDMRGYVARPAGSNDAPVVIIFQEAFGVNAHIRDIAERFAALGAIAVAPELFHRTAPVDATLAWIEAEPRARRDAVGAIGFCMGGRVAYMANARATLRGAVSFYGGGIAPALLPLASQQRAPIVMFWGGLDAHIAPEQYRSVSDALTEAKADHEQVVFSHADHGFFCDRRASYHPGAAKQAWALTRAFFEVHGVLG